MTTVAVGLAILAGLAGSEQVAVMGPRALGIGLLGIGAALSLVR